MTSSRFKNERDGLFVDIKYPGAGPNAIAFGQSLEHTINGLLISMETREDAVVAGRKFSATFQTTIERSLVGTVVANQLKITLKGVALIWATQNR